MLSISIYQLKTAFQNLLRPICNRLAKAGIRPNQITLTAMLLSAAIGLYIFLDPGSGWPLILLPLVLFLRMALNALDGMLAKEHNLRSRSGVILNELGDVLSDIVIYLPMALIPMVNSTLLVITVIAGLVVEYSGVVVSQLGVERRFDGPMGKSDRAFVFGTMGFLIGMNWLSSPSLVNGILILTSFLSLLTVVNRSVRALRDTNAC